ncbi:ABC transporter permease [Persicitalea sp.]|uniref:ABC transporter permease n=1 Tax=Persicitalea sp. TaxID=3100273 RepID=UPI0035933FF7
MLKNTLKITLRAYLRDRSFTLINLVSLTIGLFVAYAAIGYIRYELSYDTFHKNAESVYRMARNYRSQGYSVIGFANWSDANGHEQRLQIAALKATTGVKDAVQFITSDALEFVEAGEQKIQENNILTTNTPQAFTSVFSWQLRQGSFQDFANGYGKVILTASTARKLFGEEALNQPDFTQRQIRVDGENYTLAAIIDDVPLNSHVDFNMVLSQPKLDYWGSRIYVQTEDGYDGAAAEKQINAAVPLFNPGLVEDPLYKGHFLQPITDIHLDSNLLYELKPPGNRNYIVLIGCFAVFIIIITLFNYANLSLALKSKQSKSIGVRKALGAMNAAIAGQFVLEGVLLALIALPVAALAISLLIPSFNTLMGTNVEANVFAELGTFATVVGLAAIIGLLSSVLPALLLSWRNTVSLFKENLRSNLYQNFPVRKYLVISQFVILISITSVSYFVTRQIDFVENKDLGFEKEHILYAYSSPDNLAIFQEKLRQLPEVEVVGNGSSFGITPFNQLTYKLQGTDEIYDDAHQLYLDYAALQAYGLKTFPENPIRAGESNRALLINQTAAKKLAARQKIPVNDLIGKTIVTEPEYVAENGQVGFPFTVAGIFEDINLFSLHEKVNPYFIMVSKNVRMDGRSIVKYNAAAAPDILAHIQAAYDGMNEPFPLEVEYLGAKVSDLYQQDRQTADLLFYFNLIAVVLAALGIVGISMFLTVARTKEIVIRKVLGASPFSIIQSATKEYVVLVGIALLFGAPIAYYAVGEWLENFAYHIEIQPAVFVGAGLLTLVLTAVIVGFIAYRAALVNPVESLRSE